MKVRKMLGVLLVGAAVVGCLSMSAGAQGGGFHLQAGSAWGDVDNTGAVTRATNQFSMEVPRNTILTADKAFSLEVRETVTINAAYSPTSASMDFGLVDSDGNFYYLTVTGGSINRTIEVSKRGEYTLAVRNNSSDLVRVAGFVNY